MINVCRFCLKAVCIHIAVFWACTKSIVLELQVLVALVHRVFEVLGRESLRLFSCVAYVRQVKDLTDRWV